MVKDSLSCHDSLVEDVISESILWVKVSKDVLGINMIFDEFDIFSQDILLLKSKYDCAICLCGDLNARTGCLTDFVTIDDVIVDFVGDNTFENDIFMSKPMLESFGIETKRFNCDKIINNNGYKLIDMCKNHDLHIINGRFGDE